MIDHIKIFFPGDGKVVTELQIEKDGVTKLFFDKEDKSTLVVCTEDNIVTYTGFLYVAIKSYKKEVEK